MPTTIILKDSEEIAHDRNSKTISVPDGRNNGAKEIISRMVGVLSILPPWIDKRVFATSLVVAANELKESKANECSNASFVIAAFNAARIGLSPGSLMGLTYFIPRKRRINLEIGYKGYLELGYRAKFLKSCYADVVLRDEVEMDLFRFEVKDNRAQIYHRPLLDRDTVDNASLRTKVIGAYACWETTAGGSSCRWITRHQLDSVDTQSNVWASNYYEMCRKSPLRLGAKDWRMTCDLSEALNLDYLSESGQEQHRYDQIGCVPSGDNESTPFSLKGMNQDG